MGATRRAQVRPGGCDSPRSRDVYSPREGCMSVATDLLRGARAVERLVHRTPISRLTADDARAALRLAHIARALLVENHALRRRVAFLQASHHAAGLHSEPQSHQRAFRG